MTARKKAIAEETFLMAQLLAKAIHIIETRTGKNWMADPETHSATQKACKTILDAFRPPGARHCVEVSADTTMLTERGRVGNELFLRYAAHCAETSAEMRLMVTAILARSRSDSSRLPRPTAEV